MTRALDVDERHVRSYRSSIAPAHLLSADRTRQLTPRELVHVLLFGNLQPDYVHAMARRDLPQGIR